MSDTQMRCAECGYGATTGTMLFSTPGASPPLSEAAILQRVERARERAADAQRTFANASFAPHGLDPRWSGLRWFGGWGASNGRVNRLELAHGDDPYDVRTAQVRVETRPAAVSGDPKSVVRLLLATRELVQHFWRETGVLRNDVRRAAFTTEPCGLDPTEPWDSTHLRIDDTTVAFRVLANDDFWVARGSYGTTVVSVQAKQWPLSETGLVTFHDLSPYEDGSIEIATRQPPL